MAEKLTEDDLLTIMEAEVENSAGLPGSTLSNDRIKSMEYYLIEDYGNEQTDRSKAKSSDVQDTVEWIMPTLMRIFMGGESVVEFNPEGQEDIPLAAQATQFTNYTFMRQNPGFQIMMTWFKDALIQKLGVVKAFWEVSEEVHREEFAGLLQDELDTLLLDDNVELLEMTTTEIFDEMGGPVELIDVAISRKVDTSKEAVINVPPEEFLITKRAKDISSAPFVAHRTRKTVSELREENFEINEDDFEGIESESGDSIIDSMSEEDARFSKEDDTNLPNRESRGEALDFASRLVWVTEGYLKVDFDGDGIAELRKVTMVGKKILENEIVLKRPFYLLTPIPVPHKVAGLSVADTVMELQLIKSTIYRSILDNMYQQNNGRFEVLEGMVNLDDMLSSRPNGIVRVKAQGSVKRLDQPQLPQTSFDFINIIDSDIEKRTGVSKNTKGLNEGALASHTSGVAVNQVLSSAEQRVELIARVFAETGVKALFVGMYNDVVSNDAQTHIVRLRENEEFTEISPMDWKARYDTSVKVGIGRGSKQEKLQGMVQMGQVLQTVAGQDKNRTLIDAEKVYNFVTEYQKVLDLDTSLPFINNPADMPPPQPPQPDPTLVLAEGTLEVERGKLELAKVKQANDAEFEKIKLELKDKDIEFDYDIDKEKNRLNAVKS
jgi:hypothetical protein